MKYDFTSILDRYNHDALAVDAVGSVGGFAPSAPKDGFDLIPMWVADMNFPTAPSICEAMAARISHPAFGYFSPAEEYFSSIIRWHEKRNGVRGLCAGHIGYENGVLGGVISALSCIAAPGDAVLLHSPTYIGFTFALKSNGFNIILSDLIKDADGIYRMDYEDMDAKIKAHHIHAAIFCSPHNPCGRVWDREELEKAMAVYEANDVTVISDEIWSDLTLADYRHIPTQSVNEWARENVIALYAPSKTFNLAGLVGSYHIIYNATLRDRITSYEAKTEYNSMNVLSMHALIGAYKDEGSEWVDELKEVLTGNVDFAYDFICKYLDGVSVSRPQGTYMMFLDCSDYCQKSERSLDEVLQAGWDVGVGWQDGRKFHGSCHIRLNLASPKQRIAEAFERMRRYVFI